MKDEEPVFVKPFKPIYAHRKIIEEQLQQWLKDDIIRPSDSEFNSPIFLVPKRTGPDDAKRYRLVVDFRFLNCRCIGQLFPLPEINSILKSLGDATVFSVIDLKMGTYKFQLKRQTARRRLFP